jgi:enoyl-CoA hydratase
MRQVNAKAGPEIRLEDRSYKCLTVERPEAGIALVTLARPERLNALNEELFADLEALSARTGDDSELRCLIVTGSGRAFCAGGDYETLARMPASAPAEIIGLLNRCFAAILAFHRIAVPVIAAVNGPAAGGGLALALAADLRLAAPGAVFVAPFMALGITGCDVGLSWFLPRTIGLARTSEMLLTGRRVDAIEAERIGLVNRVVPAEELIEQALELAGTLAGHSPLATSLTKEGLRLGVDAPSLEAAMALEIRQQALTLQADELGRLRELR